MSLTSLIKTIQDIMRKDVGVDGDAQRISQMVWLIFLKIFDDKEQEWQLTEPGYKSPLPGRFRWSSWARDPEGMTGEELIDFVNNDLFPALKRLATAAGVPPRGKVVGSVFEDAYNYMKSGTLLRQVINTIQADVDFNVSGDRHLFNDLYEKILADLQSAGNAGEYYTPRAVTRFMVDMLDPQLGESLLDPACGTGGFLTCAIEHLGKQIKTSEDRQRLQAGIHGVEKKPLPHMLAMTNLMLHGIDVPTNIRHDNTLGRPLKDYGPRDRVDLIITNPPFGGMEEDGIENNFPRKYQTRETADLFMALIMHLLRHDTGRAAVVLPDGFLFGEGTKTTLKRELLEEFNLHTIVRLPKGVFAPYTSISTNVLFFEKGGPTRDVWFFEHPYPEGYKSYSRSKPLTIAEFDLEKAWWGGKARKGRKTTEQAWKISAKALAERNYNLDSKNPHENEITHRDPEELMAEYQQIVQQLEAAQQALKEELTASLGARHEKDGTFAQLLESIQAAHQELTAQAGRAVNISLTLRNWLIGQYIEEYERNGVDRAEYGEKWMDKLAEQLDRQGVSRCDRRELYRYRQFYLTYPQIVQALPAQFQQLHIKGIPDCGVADSTMRQAEISPSPVDGKTLISKLSFTHINELITLDNPTQRAFYEAECIRGNWSVRELKRQIGSLYFERSGLSLDKQKLSKLANASAEVETSLNIRDPYIFEFLGLKPAEVMSESHLEEGKIQTFIDAQLRDVTS